jgi:hypothetical protein
LQEADLAYEHREGQGSLFKNDNRTSDKHPHARGDAMIGGVLYEVAAWTKEGAKGKFQSLAFKPKDERREPAPRDDPRKVANRMDRHEDLEDEVPF